MPTVVDSRVRPASLSRPPASRTERLFGVGLAAVSEDEVVDWALNRLGQGDGGWICPINLDVLRQIVRDGEIRELVDSADLAVADGMPLVWASRLQRGALPERVAGSSLIRTLSAGAAEAGYPIYLLGGNEGAAEAAGLRLGRENPGLRIAGWHCPPFGFERVPLERSLIDRRLRESDVEPGIVFVGLGFPKQDRLITELRDSFPQACFVSCGISFSILAGERQATPTFLQRSGLEWAHRMVQEPKRLARRYLLLDIPFALTLMGKSFRVGLARRARVGGGENPLDRGA